MDDDEGRVQDLLEQCVDHAALRLSTVRSDALDADLLARLERLKVPPLASNPTPATRVDADGLQSDLAERLVSLKKNPSNPPPTTSTDTDGLRFDLAERLAALKKGPSKKDPMKQDPLKAPAPEVIETARLSKTNRIEEEMHQGDAFEVEKLLQSVHDCVRLERSGDGGPKSYHNNDSDEEISDSEVDQIVEWAKDAAVLEEDEEDNALDADLPTSPTLSHSPQKKKKGSRWKFW